MKSDQKSFIVRIWIESTPDERTKPTWRGVIEHVGSDERAHFHNLASITDFISKKTGLRPKVSRTEWWKITKTGIIDEIRKLLPHLQ